MRISYIVIQALVLAAFLTIPAAAAGPTVTQTTFPTYSVTVDIDPWSPQTDPNMRFWFANGGDLTRFDAFGFLYSFVHVYNNFFGELFYLIIYVIYLYLVWNRSRGLELVIVGGIATAGIWEYIMVIFAMAIASILYKLLNTRG